MAAKNEAATADQSTGAWTYDNSKDEMRGTTTSFARVSSDNEISVGAPYDDAHAELALRKRPSDGVAVMLSGPGQFLCSEYSGGHVSVKFDAGPIQRFSCSEPSSSTTGIIFINSEQKFIEKVKAAKKMVIEAEFFQAGPRQMVFEVEGLKWPPHAD